TLLAGAAASPLAAHAQRAVKLAPRVGVLLYGTPETDPNYGSFLRGLRELGYVENQNIVLEPRSAEGKWERLPLLARELVAARPDLIYVLGGDVAPSVRAATSTIPIVMAVSNDPVLSNLVASLARPGGNIIAFADRHRLMLASGWAPWAREGALLTYGPDLDEITRRSAAYVDKILRGASPADIPVEQPTRFQLVLNAKSARELGLTIPE